MLDQVFDLLFDTVAEMLRDGFGEKPWFHCLIAEEVHDRAEKDCPPDKIPVGYALYHYGYSTFVGRVLFLQDLFVDTASRGWF